MKLVSLENRPAWAKSWEMRLVGLSPVHPALPGLVCGVLFAYAAGEPASRMLRLGVFSSDALFSLMVLPLAFWLFTRAAYFTISGIQSVASVVERDLSANLRPLKGASCNGVWTRSSAGAGPLMAMHKTTPF